MKTKVLKEVTFQRGRSGATAFLPWKNSDHPDLADALRIAFDLADNEELVGIEIREDGIQATIGWDRQDAPPAKPKRKRRAAGESRGRA